MADNNREHFRIIYPTSQRPNMMINGRTYPVIEVSEGGCSILLPREDPMLKKGLRFHAMITFGKRGNENIAGVFVRIEAGKYSIKFDEGAGVPLPRIMEEQRYLIKLTKP